jgi:hypothetical protein
MFDTGLRRVLWRVVDHLDYVLTLVKLRVLDAVAGTEPETPADQKREKDREQIEREFLRSRRRIGLAFAAKMYLWIASGELHSAFVSPTVLKAARAFIVPEQLPLWHVTSAFNALASWCLYFLSDYYYKHWQEGVQIPENALRYLFLWLPLIMNTFTIYSLFCTVYITVQLTSTLDLPPLHAKLFPWP